MSLDTGVLQDIYILEFYEALNCSRSLAAYMLYKYKEHAQLVNLEFNPSDYNLWEEAANSLAATKFLSKATFLSTNIDLKAVAMDKFFEAEKVCAQSNRRIFGSWFKTTKTSDALLSASYKIAKILGEIDPEDLVNSCDWGPGASTLLRKSTATRPEKFAVERQITARAYDFVKDWFHIAYPNMDVMFEIVSGNKVVTVPKNSKTDRTIAIEPGFNLWFQKGIGRIIRRKLRTEGLDLSDQTINQKFSKLGSRFNHLATVDFSMASDTISIEIVRELLPPKWFDLLFAFRSSSGSFEGKAINYEKFSSMGNGFTFELETLIFYALAVACCDILDVSGSVSVYGDDVIIPSQAVDLFYSVCEDCGFTVNTTKSYGDGNYRESCGDHYWCGWPIKPIFHKESLDGQQSLIVAANQLRTFSRSRDSHGCDSRFRRCWQLLVDYLGPKCPRISAGYGDLGIIENFSEVEDVKRPGHGIEGYLVRVYCVQSVSRERSDRGLLLFKLKSLSSSTVLDPFIGRFNYLSPEFLQQKELSQVGNHIPMPGRIRYSRKRILIPQWHDIGQWT